jgi:hypothetical protein
VTTTKNTTRITTPSLQLIHYISNHPPASKFWVAARKCAPMELYEVLPTNQHKQKKQTLYGWGLVYRDTSGWMHFLFTNDYDLLSGGIYKVRDNTNVFFIPLTLPRHKGRECFNLINTYTDAKDDWWINVIK